MNFTILRFDQLESTNTEALTQAKRGGGEGLCVVARQQTMGRGRHGRVWVSPPDAGLYFSIVLRPRLETRFLPLITLMTAVAVHDTLEMLYSFECDIKWVNDILVRGKKICGILAETGDTPQGLTVIAGIGINLSSANFPADLGVTATSIADEIGTAAETERLLEHLTRFLSYFYEILQQSGGAEQIRDEWTKRSSYAFGKSVRAVLDHHTIFGTTCGIAADGALRVKIETGEIKIIHAGEVEQLRTI